MSDIPRTEALRAATDPFVTSEAVEKCLAAHENLERELAMAVDLAELRRYELKAAVKERDGYLESLQQRAKACLKAMNERDSLQQQLAESHAVLDNDPSKIIRNAKDGYPEGRPDRELTLAERISALCKYASDYSKWFAEAEAELARWREGGITEEMLRAYDGYIALNKGCEIAIAGTSKELFEMKAALAAMLNKNA